MSSSVPFGIRVLSLSVTGVLGVFTMAEASRQQICCCASTGIFLPILMVAFSLGSLKNKCRTSVLLCLGFLSRLGPFL